MIDTMEDDRMKCHRCNCILKNDEFVHKISYSGWDINSGDFKRDPQENYYCQDCWSQRKKDMGTEFYVESVDQIWNVLNSSNGELVADISSHFIGSNSQIQIVEGNVTVAYTRSRWKSDDVVSFYSEFDEMSKDEFYDIFNDIVSGDLPSYIKLYNHRNTPFNEYPNKGNRQLSIKDFDE